MVFRSKGMKALSVMNPYAWLICKGYKDVENRSWKTAIRGKIYIHASQTIDHAAFSLLPATIPHPIIRKFMPGGIANPGMFKKGAIIGEVEIIDCKFRFPDENANLYSVWHVPGQWGWILANAVLYDIPIPYKGHQRLFDVPHLEVPHEK
jgi:hypothetical protein